ncbi:PREDICTED: uncharacterized protein LOC104757918, partial [Camelina sativa]|uniref:Uncharacterized protein LOC104757918 n=1 Tax=Camelina sativa TaxID=90675 RepID=A0ABM0X0Y8_CAMSA
MRRSHIPDLTEIKSYGDRSHIKVESAMNQQTRPPLSVVAHNAAGINGMKEQKQTSNAKESDGEDKGTQEEVFLKKDDPKVTALIQQAELLSSLAQKVNVDNTDQSMENAWKVLQDFLNKSKENDLFRYGIPYIDSKGLDEDLRISNEDSQTSWKQPDLHDSPASSDYSSGSTVMPPHPSDDKTQQPMPDTQTTTSQKQNDGQLPQAKVIVPDVITVEHVDLLTTCQDVLKNPNEIVVPMSGDEEFHSPVQVTPFFRSLAAGIPSPQFSESIKPQNRLLNSTM